MCLGERTVQSKNISARIADHGHDALHLRVPPGEFDRRDNICADEMPQKMLLLWQVALPSQSLHRIDGHNAREQTEVKIARHETIAYAFDLMLAHSRRDSRGHSAGSPA